MRGRVHNGQEGRRAEENRPSLAAGTRRPDPLSAATATCTPLGRPALKVSPRARARAPPVVCRAAAKLCFVFGRGFLGAARGPRGLRRAALLLRPFHKGTGARARRARS